MNWTHFLPTRWRTSPSRLPAREATPLVPMETPNLPVANRSTGTRENPFRLPSQPPLGGLTGQVQESRSFSTPAEATARRSKKSWLGMLLGQNRRRENTARLVQGELRLRDVKPVRNDLRDDDVALIERRASRVIWETPVADRPRDDQDLAWNRLRERRRTPAVVEPD